MQHSAVQVQGSWPIVEVLLTMGLMVVDCRFWASVSATPEENI
eukprot:COSAG02_NODE_6676_length_3424_cov_13.333835_4_plen_43_part_00